MPRPHISMRKIRDVLRLSLHEGLSLRQVAASVQMPFTTVADHVRRAGAAGLSWPLPDDLDDDGLEACLFASAVPAAEPRPLPDWQKIHVELRRPGVTLMLLWLEVRTLGRLYVRLMDERRAWQQRIHAQLFHQGAPPFRGLLTAEGRATLAGAQVTPAGRQMLDTALVAIDSLTEVTVPLRAQLQAVGAHQPGARALMARYGIGALSAVIIWAELGDCRRFSRSDQAVRFAGLDVTVWSSDGKRSPGHHHRHRPAHPDKAGRRRAPRLVDQAQGGRTMT